MNVDNWSEPFFALREKEGGEGGGLEDNSLFIFRSADRWTGIFF